jgi:hypothetical protein
LEWILNTVTHKEGKIAAVDMTVHCSRLRTQIEKASMSPTWAAAGAADTEEMKEGDKSSSPVSVQFDLMSKQEEEI